MICIALTFGAPVTVPAGNTALNRSVLADSTKVVPRKVHQHDMLRFLLLILQQFGGECSIPCCVARERPCSGDRKGLDSTSSLPDEHFRTGSDYLSVSELEVVHVWRRVDLSQCLIEPE